MFAELEPFGPERMDMNIANVVATLMDIHKAKSRSKSRSMKPTPLENVVLKFGDSKRDMVSTMSPRAQQVITRLKEEAKSLPKTAITSGESLSFMIGKAMAEKSAREAAEAAARSGQ